MIDLRAFIASFSALGLWVGLVFFCASLTPSLLPRTLVVQGVLGGVALATGYGAARAGHGVWRFMELKDVRPPRIVSRTVTVIMVLAVVLTLGRMTTWQNSIRLRMEMEPIDHAYPVEVCLVALITATALILLGRGLRWGATRAVVRVDRYLPRRISIVLGTTVFVILIGSFVNGVIVKRSLRAMDNSFAVVNRLLDDEEPPRDERASGSARSLIGWDEIGRNGKRFVADGPTQDEIAEVLGREAMAPIRVYAGFDTGETLEERAQTALAELERVGGFDRSTLIVATATGTGWLDPSAVDPVEFIHAGDIATVSLQYSYLPSWLTLMVEPELSRQAAHALFDAVYGHWTTLPPADRPALYLHGLSLGALGSEDSADFITMAGDPIDGALWSGPPFLSRGWSTLTRDRNPGTPQWRPVFRNSSVIRFMTQDGFPDLGGADWGPVRIVYLQHASDPMTFFSTDMAFVRPDWLGLDRARDVSPYLRWFPIVSFLQVAFDIPMATSVPLGYGHNFAPDRYIDAWIEVTRPGGWSATDTEKLKAHFADFDPDPL